MIYFLLNAESLVIKIGYSADPRGRVDTLQTASPHDLTLLGVIDGEKEDERLWHMRFRTDRVRGEWFRVTGPLLAAIVDARLDAHLEAEAREAALLDQMDVRIAQIQHEAANVEWDRGFDCEAWEF